MQVTKVYWTTELINTTSGSASSPVTANCADVVFINLHPTDAYIIDGMPLIAGASTGDGCNQGEYNDHEYVVIGPAPVTVAGFQLGLYLKRKHYRKIDTIRL